MTNKEIARKLKAFAAKQFEGAESVTVEKSEFGFWNIEVDWDGGYLVETHSYAVENGKFRFLGVIEEMY